MNVLWIEDDNIEDISNSIGLDDLFVPNNINLITPNDYSEALLKVKEANIEYDFVIIDINLEKWDFDENIILNISKEYALYKTNLKFKEEAGFHLFIKLILQNFEKNRIVFLTGNTNSDNKIEEKDNSLRELINLLEAKIENKIQEKKVIVMLEKYIQRYYGDKESQKIMEILNNSANENLNIDLSEYLNSLGVKEDNPNGNTYELFVSRFKNARIPIAKSIHKNDERGFHNWFSENLSDKNQDFKYILFRRGVIDAIQELSENLIENNLLLNKYHKDNKSKKHLEYYKNYLKKLILFLPHKKPIKLSEYLFVFIKEVTSELDFKLDYSTINGYSQFQQLCISQTKKIRNWSTHDHLKKENINEELAAYIFLISMRAIFDLNENEIQSYEKKVLSIFNYVDEIPKQTDLKKNIAKSYFEIADSQLSKTKSIGFIEMLNNTTYKSKISYTNLFELFWHGLHPARQKVKPTSNRYTSENDDYVKTFINFDDFNFNKSPIAKSIGQAIYNLSFPS